MDQPLNLLSAIDRCGDADQPVAWRAGTAVSHAELRARVAAWADLLGVLPGGAFALYHGDAIEFAAALFGGWLVRKTIFLPGDNLPATCAALRHEVAGFLGEFSSEWRPSAAPFGSRAARADAFQPIDSESIGLVLYTSGSTGAPQPISKKISQLVAEVANLEQQFGRLLGRAAIVSTVSHQHIYGLLFNVLWPLTAGRPIQARSLPWFEDLSALLSERAAVLVSSPAHLRRLPESPAWAEAAAHLSAVFSSGGPLPFDAARACKQLMGQVPIEVYGSSETGGIAWRQQFNENQPWSALPGVEWRIAGDDAVLEVSSAHLPNRQWFRTADRAQAAGEGQFLLGGRVDGIVKIEGKRISLSAIENLLSASPLVDTVRVLAIDGWRHRVAAFVVPNDEGRRELQSAGRRGLTRALRRMLSEAIEAVGIPRLWRYLDALPVNAQGKTARAELLALLELPSARLTEPQARLVERTAERARFELVAPRRLIYFEGHFHDQPILPGVVQLDWAIAYGRRCFALPARFRAVHALKFQRVITPGLPLNLELNYRPANSTLCFTFSSALGVHASGRVLFGNADV